MTISILNSIYLFTEKYAYGIHCQEQPPLSHHQWKRRGKELRSYKYLFLMRRCKGVEAISPCLFPGGNKYIGQARNQSDKKIHGTLSIPFIFVLLFRVYYETPCLRYFFFYSGRLSTTGRNVYIPACGTCNLSVVFSLLLSCTNSEHLSPSMLVVPMCANRNFRHSSGNLHSSAYCHHWLFPFIPSRFTGTIADNRH